MLWTKNLWTFRSCIFSSLLKPQVATSALGSDQGGGQRQQIVQRHRDLGFAGFQYQAEFTSVSCFAFKDISCFKEFLQVTQYLEPLLMRMLSRIVSVQ